MRTACLSAYSGIKVVTIITPAIMERQSPAIAAKLLPFNILTGFSAVFSIGFSFFFLGSAGFFAFAFGFGFASFAFFFSFLSSFFFALFLADLEGFFPSSPFNSFNILTFSSAAVSGSSSPKSSFPPKRETILERKDGFFSPSCESAASLGFFSFFSFFFFFFFGFFFFCSPSSSCCSCLGASLPALSLKGRSPKGVSPSAKISKTSSGLSSSA